MIGSPILTSLTKPARCPDCLSGSQSQHEVRAQVQLHFGMWEVFCCPFPDECLAVEIPIIKGSVERSILKFDHHESLFKVKRMIYSVVEGLMLMEQGMQGIK